MIVEIVEIEDIEGIFHKDFSMWPRLWPRFPRQWGNPITCDDCENGWVLKPWIVFGCGFCQGILAIKQRGSTWFGTPSSWYTYLRHGIEGHYFISWFSAHITQVSTLFKSIGHSLKVCFFLHLGQKMDNAKISTFCLFCILRVLICSLRLPKIFVLKLSRKFSNSSPLTVPTTDDLKWSRLVIPC